MLRWLGVAAALALVALVLALEFFYWRADEREVFAADKLAPATGRYVPGGDTDVFIQETGLANGPVVLFIHGTGAWSETWRDTLNALAASGWRAGALDLPPFGFSRRPANGDYSPAAQGERIVGMLDSLKVERAVLVGHSFGGGPTVEAALLASGRVRALVLVDAALGLGDGTPQKEEPSLAVSTVLGSPTLRNRIVAAFLTNPGFTRKLIEAFIADPKHATDARVAVYQKPLAVQGTTPAIGQWLPALLAPDASAASRNPANYRALKLPVYVIWGDRDTITPLAQGTHLAGLVPGAKLAVMAGAGHIPQIEDPDAFNRLLIAFLSGLTS